MKSPYHDLVYCPIDLPSISFNREEFFSWWDKEAVPTTLYTETGNVWTTAQHGKTINPKLSEIIPELRYFIDQLPFTEAIITLLEQKFELPCHSDRPYSTREYVKLARLWPCSYRLWILNDQPDASFYIMNIANGMKIYPRWPNMGEPWLFNAYDTNIQHGSDKLRNDCRKIILAVRPTEFKHYDKERHFQIIRDGLDKYGEYSIWRKDFE